MKNYLDGGEAILEAFRKLKIDYIMSSPGSEWSPVWEALARAALDQRPTPRFLESWHETLAVNMATGYTLINGHPQAVLVHAGVGMLQGSMGVHGALQNEVPMVVLSGESVSLGEDPELDIEQQWYGGLSVGGIERFVEPVTKWARAVASPHTLYESIIRAGEMAQRTPKGPVYLNVPLEHMLHPWTPPADAREVPRAPRLAPRPDDIAEVAALVRKAANPVIVAEGSGRDPTAFAALVELAELLAIPVINGRAQAYANFPTDHALYQGVGNYEALGNANLVLLVSARAPWYPARRRPTAGKIVTLHDNPVKAHLVYQNWHSDLYLEGDVASTLALIAQSLREGKIDSQAVTQRRQRAMRGHEQWVERLAAEAQKARAAAGIEPVALFAELDAAMPADTIYVDETITHSGALRQHLPQRHPHSFFRGSGGLGQGIGTALGIKLAAGARPVALIVGDGSFLYNPVIQALGAARQHQLPILIIIVNNRKYAAMRMGHVHHYPDGAAVGHDIRFGVDIAGLDYERLADHFGFHGARVERLDEVAPALTAALGATREGRTSILNVLVNR